MTTTTFVLSMNGGKPKWSRYVYPFAIDGFAQLADSLYIRNGDIVSKVVEGLHTDDVAGVATNFSGAVQWHWLDFGQPGVTKMVEGFDYVGTGQAPTVSFGYDQRNVATLSAGYLLSEDTVPGTMIPYPISAPTLSVRLDFAGGAAWSVQAVQLYLHDNRAGA